MYSGDYQSNNKCSKHVNFKDEKQPGVELLHAGQTSISGVEPSEHLSRRNGKQTEAAGQPCILFLLQ